MFKFSLNEQNKEKRYLELLPQIEAVIQGESDWIANYGNVVAMLKEAFAWHWIGFYRFDEKDGELVLSVFQGPLACTRIAPEKGICGRAYTQQKTIVVRDVLADVDHIACSSLTRSEIVLPIKDEQGRVLAVLDIDSVNLNDFDVVDVQYLEQLVSLLPKPY